MTDGLLDTNVIVRYLVRDGDLLPLQARSIIESQANLFVTEGVIAEAAYVLVTRYTIAREAVIDALIGLMRRDNVQPYQLDKRRVIQALELCRPSGRVGINDALLWAVARSSDSPVVYSFDKRFPEFGVEVRDTI